MKQTTTFKSIDDAKGINIDVMCTMDDNTQEITSFKAEDIIVKDTICWSGYYVSNIIIRNNLSNKVKSFHIV